MANKEIIFRVDGSHRKGIGHLMRCLELADQLKKHKVRTVFFSHHSPLQVSIASAFDHRIFYQRGYAGEVTIARNIRDYLGKHEVSGLLVDLPEDLDSRTMRIMNSISLPKIILDDHGIACKEFDTVVNAIAHPDQLEEPTRDSGLFQGPDYIILPQSTAATRSWSCKSKKVLIAMGGSDPHNITLKALNALAALKTDLEIHLLLGPGYSENGSIEDARKEIFQPTYLHKGIDTRNFPDFLAEFKFAIMSFGLTVYSAASVGLPLICLAHNPQGAKAADTFFSSFKTGIFVGDQAVVDTPELVKEIRAFLSDEPRLQTYSEKGKGAVDGKGLERVTEIILDSIN